MREIKFRAWDTKHSLMVWFPRLDITSHPDGSTDYRAGVKILMQYTGLKDKNGKEIYEGDILRVGELEDLEHDSDATVHAVKWFGDDGYPAFDIDGNQSESNFFSEMANDIWYCEVIGNIYENPELLSHEA